MPSIGQTWVLASIGVVEMADLIRTLKRLLMESKGLEACKHLEWSHERCPHLVHTAPSTALLWLWCFWPCRHPLWFRLGLHAEARWSIRSNRPVAPNSSILNKPRLLPLIHARLPVSQQWASVIHQIYSAPPAAVVLMNSLPQNKYLLVIFSGRQPMAR
jgi:hypothetical protein